MSEQSNETPTGAPVGKSPERHPDLPPPRSEVGVLGWLRANLFSSAFDTVLTLLALFVLYFLVTQGWSWLIADAVIDADSRNACREAGSGACWAVIKVRLDQFIYGFYPEPQRWRPNLAFVLLIFALIPLLYDRLPHRRKWLYGSLAYPFVAFLLIYGGLGLPIVETNTYGGFVLTLIVGVTGIAASLPLGIALALGRQSKLLAVKVICVTFIELLRGVPLITILFVASTMLNYFLPPGTEFNLLVRVLIMVTLFAAAYIAEVVRGGLQAVPRGQYEAADAMGLTYGQTMRLVILPQALKISIPGIMNTFIGLYKDTTLVMVIGLLDPLGIGRAALGDAKWNGLSTEIYLFVSLFFFVSCFAMSQYSLWLERRLSTDHRVEG